MKGGDFLPMLKIPFFRIGKWKHPKYGTITGTQKKFKQFTENFKKKVLGREPFIRIGHDKGNSQTFGDAEAKAWVKDIVQEGDVIYALAEPADPEVEKLIREKRYRFASAEYDDNFINKETGLNVGSVLSAIGLTNEPFLTRLPENIVLAEDSEEFYMDYKESEGIKPMDEFLKKLSDMLNTFVEKLKGTQPGELKKPDEGNEDVEKLLSELATVKIELADIKQSNTELTKSNQGIQKANDEKAVELKLSELKTKGIPPVLCDKAKVILLSFTPAETIKLSDGAEKKLSDLVYDLLESLPEDTRVNYKQLGSHQVKKDGEQTQEELVKLAEEDVKELGGTVSTDGKFVI